ncbi:peptidoglycan binding protein CsiV [Gammaproteobacteria bacterium]|nr:peptidoglycan binding protein CsiV [Gammaproteobacteria bacterium]
MKYKLSLLLTLLSINLFSEEQLYLVDLILIKYLPDFETNEKFLPPELDIPDNITFLTEFPYPKLEINSLPFNLEYKFQDLFMSVKIEEDSDLSVSEDETPSDIESIPTLEVDKSVFEIDSAREFSLSAEVSKIARSRDFRVISTKSWFQNIKDKDAAELIFIDSDFFKGTRIFGFFQLYKERFLHFNTKLYLSELDPLFTQDEILMVGKNVFNEEKELDIYEEKNQKVLYEVVHSKKFRSGELHYVDHPKFGMLIMLTKAQKKISSPDNGSTKN